MTRESNRFYPLNLRHLYDVFGAVWNVKSFYSSYSYSTERLLESQTWHFREQEFFYLRTLSYVNDKRYKADRPIKTSRRSIDAFDFVWIADVVDSRNRCLLNSIAVHLAVLTILIKSAFPSLRVASSSRVNLVISITGLSRVFPKCHHTRIDNSIRRLTQLI